MLHDGQAFRKKRGMNLKNHYPIEKIKEMNPTERVGSDKKDCWKVFC